ncbi:MAG: phosphoglycerate mutase family protein [Daejeonella sp.]
MRNLNILLAVFVAVSSLSFTPVFKSGTTVYIVRHAEKDVSDLKNPDPDLSVDGEKRASHLTAKLKREKFDAVFSTRYKRTIQTVYLVAGNNNVNVEYYDPADFKGLSEIIKTKFKNRKVLIAGHSNTVLELAEAFGVKRPVAALTDDDYDFLFKITIDDTGNSYLKTRHYGKSHHTSEIKK